MSTSKDIWRTYVEGMVREYPERAAALGDLHAMKMTARYSLEPGGGGPERTTEAVATRQLPEREQREYDSVRAALEQVLAMPDGDLRLRLVRLVYWDRSCRLTPAAKKIGISKRTAIRWKGAFIRAIADNYWQKK